MALRLTAGSSVVWVCVACTAPSTRTEAPPKQDKPSEVTRPTPAAPPPPSEPPAPRPPTAEERQRAAQLAEEAVSLLQAGDALGGKDTLDRALSFDSKNELARKMMRQVVADPGSELGSAYFQYKIQRDDSLARLAQQYLGDRYLFYILARYNNIPRPDRIQIGQVIRIPGKARSPTQDSSSTPRQPAPPTAGRSTPSQAQAPPPEDVGGKRFAEAKDMERKGDFEGALDAYTEVVRRDPGNSEAKQSAARVTQRLVDRYYGEAAAAKARQDLEGTITACDRVLRLDPNHQRAKAMRQQAIDLRDKLEKIEKKS